MMPYPEWQRDDHSVAVHEASHALVASIIGLPYIAAEVAPKGETIEANGEPVPGAVYLQPVSVDATAGNDDDAGMRLGALLMAAMYYAGFEGERLYHQAPESDGYCWTVSQDHVNAEDALLLAFDTLALAGDAQQLARDLLQHNWAQVLRIADELAQHGTITAARVGQLAGARG